MKNQDIIKEIYNRDKTGELAKCARIYNSRIKKGIRSFEGIEKYEDIFVLLMNLTNEKYQLTDKDIQVLEQHNIIIFPRSNNTTQTKDKSFIAISDFHSYTYPLDKIKNYYLNEYDVIYILGDATDRGPDGYGSGGIKLLIDIMKLSKQYPGRIVYVPGNHDEFLLGYIRSKYNMDSYYEYDYTTNLVYNGGLETVNDLNNLEREDPKTFNELISWLGKQPLQINHRHNGKDYVMGHALYNEKLYRINPNYCLEDFFKESYNSELRRMAHDTLWFRKSKNSYNPNEMPSADKIMIIGHTREAEIRGKNIDLTDSRGRTIKVHCVDGGIAYKGGMLKYDGGSDVIWTTIAYHNNTSIPKTKMNSPIDKESILKNYILNKTLQEGKLGVHQLIFGSNPNELSSTECNEIINRGIGNVYISDPELKRNLYVKTVLFDYILECQLERMQEQYKNPSTSFNITVSSIERFLSGTDDLGYIRKYGNNGKDDYYNITSHKNAREIAKIIGSKVIEDVLSMHGCKTVEEYMNNKFSKKKNDWYSEVYYTNKGRR